MPEPVLEVKYDEAKLDRVRRVLSEIPQALPRVVSRGLNRTASGGRTQIVRRLSAETGQIQKDIRPGIVISKRATYVSWLAQLSFGGKGVSLMRYNPVETAWGVRYTIGSKSYLIPHTFLATMPSGHRGVFLRGRVVGYKGRLGYRREERVTLIRKKRGVYRGKTYWTELPIVERFGPSIGTLFEQTARIAEEEKAKMGISLEKNIDDQVRLVLERK